MKMVQDSGCTRDMKVQAEWALGECDQFGALGDFESAAVMEKLAVTYRAIERVSRRVDGEAAARKELADILGTVLNVLQHSHGVDGDGISQLRARLAQLT